MKTQTKEQRCKEFLSCLGNGKTIYQIEAEEDYVFLDESNLSKAEIEKLIDEQTELDMQREDFL